METITRKSMLYPTEVSYGDYAMSPVLGCAHNCAYCYSFGNKYRWQQVKSREEWCCRPKLVSNTLELLEKEIPRYRDRIKNVFLSFTTDVFMMNYPEVTKMTLDSIALLNSAGIPCTTLTKGVLPIELAYLSKENWHGITLVSLSELYRQKYEPGTATVYARLQGLKALHDAGCKTWVSIEPYPTPNMVTQFIIELLQAVSFVDHIVFGRCNYYKEATEYPWQKDFYNKSAGEVIAFCEQYGISYFIKEKTITA